tara:strand:+ start:84 stop:716 length:633 start_codon:yes stop_codon:yes gene_type:complete
MSDILRQVDEDLRKERLSNLFKKYGLYTILTLMVIIGSVIGYQVKVSVDKSNSEKLIEQYIKSINIKDPNISINGLKEITESTNNYISGLAQLKLSRLYLQNGDKKKNNIILKEIMNNNDYEQIVIDLARYYYLILNINDLSKTEFDDILSNTSLKLSKFEFLFTEIRAIRGLITNDHYDSKELFQSLISNPNVPLDIKDRANKFIKLIN